MKSVMKHSFSDTPTISAPRSKFDRSFGHKLTMDAGWLVPFMWDAVLPGDTFNVNTTLFARLSTPLFPLMDNAYIDTHFFFIPNRLIWQNFRKFTGEQENPADSIDFQIPVLDASLSNAVASPDGDLTTAQGRVSALMDYLGLPSGFQPDVREVSALPFRSYSRVYNEWFRDQNLIDSVDAGLIVDDGPDDLDVAPDQHMLQRRGKRHDYFTSALPFPQKGTAVTLPLGSSAPVTGIGKTTQTYVSSPGTIYESGGTGSTSYTTASDINVDPTWFIEGTAGGGGFPNIVADLTNATASTVNDLREAFQVQKLLERDARAGTRYSELVKNHFGVDFYDVTYRPEYLGGSSTPLNINPVAATSGSAVSGQPPVGDLAAFGTAGASGNGFTKSFVEHGIVMGFISCRADLTYQQGINRHFSHSTRYDYYWPTLAHLGEQEIKNKELYYLGNANDELVFGYQERYAEYRYKPSQISGKFRSASVATLDSWHLSQEFSSLPALGQTFIEENPPFDRVIVAPSEPHLIVDTFTSMICARPMPVFGVPGMIDHF